MADKLDGNAIIANTIPANRIQTGSITSTQLQTSLYNTVTSATHPKIRSISYPGNDTAANTGGGDTVTLTGTGFGNTGNVQIYINGNVVSSITVTNANSISFTAPALAAATYPVYLINTSDGSTAILIPGIQYSGTPSWSTSTPLTSQDATGTWSIQLVATSDSAVSYSLQAGSSLPAGITLAANGLISGTMTSPPVDETTYNFTVVANDLENQDASRAFSVTVTVAVLDPYFTYTTLLLHGDGTNNANNHAFVDSSNNAFTITRNGNASQGTFSPFGDNWSVYGDGNGDYLSLPSSSNWAFGTGDFTIEAWIYWPSAQYDTVFSFILGNNNSNDDSTWGFGISYSTKKLSFSNWNYNLIIGNAMVPHDQWVHIALTRSSGTLRTFINGVFDNSASDSTNLSGTTALHILKTQYTGLRGFTGYVSNARIVKGTALYTSSFTPSTTPLSVVANTVLLTCQSNAYLDKGPGRLAVTRNGDTRVSKFDPFKPYKAIPASYGVYFDGNSDSLTLTPNTNLDLTGAYTIEFWMYLNSIALDTQHPSIITFPSSYQIYVNSTNLYVALYNGFADVRASASNSITTNQWYHIAFSRNSSNTLSLYVNGTRVSTGTAAGTIGSSSGTLRLMSFDGSGGDANGHLSNLRIVKGTAIYDPTLTTITVPTSPLTAVANTQLLTCQSTTIIDNSTNAFTITRNGDARPTDLNPFTTTFVSEKYNTANGGGAVYFDGSGDVIYATESGSQFTFGTGDYEYSAWIYTTDTSTNQQTIFGRDNTGNILVPYIYIMPTTRVIGLYYSTVIASGTTAIAPFSWYYITVSRVSGTVRIFVNGNLEASASDSANLVAAGKVVIGGQWSVNTNMFSGYIASARVIKGSGITSVNVPPSAPLTAVANTQLLCNFTNAGILDSVGKNVLETIGDARVNTSVKKYGTGSMYFDGNGDVLSIVDDELHRLTSGDFTIECWVYPTANGALYDSGFASYGAASTLAGWFFGMSGTNTGGTLNRLIWSVNYAASGGAPVYGNAGIPLNTWTHAAVTKVGTTINLFINGVLDKSATVTATPTTSTSYKLYIGAASYDPTGTQRSLTGNIDDLRITKGVARYRYNFTPPTKAFNDGDGNLANNTTDVLVGDSVNLPVFPYTTLLLHGDGTNNANNHAFIDSSNNAFAITRNGNATQGTFSPFSPTGWSGYFASSSSDYISAASNAAFALGSGDFTLEAFVFAATSQTDNWIIGLANNCWLRIGSGGVLEFYNNITTTSIIATGVVLPLNQWIHVAAVRVGTTLTLYQNGVSIASGTVSTNFSTSVACTIGNQVGFDRRWNGYISNARVVKGTAVYTAAFTPPTSALTAIANTSLLACQSNRFIDNSNNAFALTVNGTPSVQAFSPFAPSVEYTANTHGGSAYFDGSGDYLSVGDQTAFEFGSGDYTIELWWYPTSSTDQNIIGKWDAGGSEWILQWRSAGYYRWASGGSIISDANITLRLNSWNHVAVTKSGTSLRIYSNGVQIGTTATEGTISATGAALTIGAAQINSSPLPVFGYISNLRILKGTAQSTGSTYTVPTAPVTAVANTQLLCNFTNAGIIDSTGKNVLETVGDAKVNTATKKYGTGSMYFDGTDDGLRFYEILNTQFGTGDFTVEAWVYITSFSVPQVVVDARGSTTAAAPWQFYVNASNKVVFNYGSNLIGTISVAANTWTHIAATRYGSTLRIFVNGILDSSATTSASLNGVSGQPIYVGRVYDPPGSPYFSGYIDDLRITKGIARYVTNFTPPTAAFLNK